MAIKQLSYHTAFTPGSDLWIFPDKKTSFWTKKIDWYLNFQISKPFPHIALSDQQIKQLNKEWGFTYFALDGENKTLMIGSKNFLPNTKTVILPFVREDLKSWLYKAYKVWKGINCPTLRLFLPDNQHHTNIKDRWLIDPMQIKISIVEFKSQR